MNRNEATGNQEIMHRPKTRELYAQGFPVLQENPMWFATRKHEDDEIIVFF